MASVEFDVKYIAHLARLRLEPDECAKLAAQLAQILTYVQKLQTLDVNGVEPTAHPVPMVNIVRPDQVLASLTSAEALANSPAQANGLFLVPKIVE